MPLHRLPRPAAPLPVILLVLAAGAGGTRSGHVDLFAVLAGPTQSLPR